MFKVSDFRDVGMPTRKVVATAEEGFAWAEEHGFREHAFVEPHVEMAEVTHRYLVADELNALRAKLNPPLLPPAAAAATAEAA